MMSPSTKRQLRARFTTRLQKLRDVVGGEPTDEEIVEDMIEGWEILDEMWESLKRQGVHESLLHRIEEKIPPLAVKARHLRFSMRPQTELEIPKVFTSRR